MPKKNLATFGCSLSSDSWGTSWPDYISSALDCNLIRASSPGAGNGFYIEKLNHVIKHNNIDLVIIQLTEPSRVVLGLTSVEQHGKMKNFKLNDSNSFGDLGTYTWNTQMNEDNIKRITGHEVVVDNFFIPEVSLSKWVDYKILQDICTMQYMCDSFNVPCIFWSWFVPFDKLFLPQYEWLKDRINYIDGCALDYINNNHIQCIPNDGHYDSNGQAMICDGWLTPSIEKIYSAIAR